MPELGTPGTVGAAGGQLPAATRHQVGCYPEEVMKNSKDGHVVRLGGGLMTLSRVMGTAFIRAYHLHSHAPSGPFVIVCCIPRSFVADFSVYS